MMKRFTYVFAGIALMLCFSLGCKKKDNSTPTSSSTSSNNSNSTNTLCDGNGSSSYCPLDTNDSWTYAYTMAGYSEGSPQLVITGISTMNGKQYYEVTDNSYLMYTDNMYFREDSATHNIYALYDQDYIEVPGSPTLNQSWAYYNSHTRKVTSLSASLTTSGCSYSGLLEITDYDSSGNPTMSMFYKKGLGLVAKHGAGSYGSNYDLTAVTLH